MCAIGELSIREKIGQMIMVGFRGARFNREFRSLLSELKPGGLIFFSENLSSPEEIARLSSEIQSFARENEPGIPLFLAIDQEGGRVARLKEPFTQFPPAITLGSARSRDLAFGLGKVLAQEMRAVGLNMNFAPVLDLSINPLNHVIGDRAFSAEAEMAASLGVSFIEGSRSAAVIAVGKHFPGHGASSGDSHVCLPAIEEGREALSKRELIPFIAAIEAGLEAIMTAHVLYPALDKARPATLSGKIVGGLLRRELSFEGLVITDDLDMKAISDHYDPGEAASLAIRAGCDLLLWCRDHATAARALERIEKSVQNGEIEAGRIDGAVERIIGLKEKYRYAFDPVEVEAAKSVIGSAEARELSVRLWRIYKEKVLKHK